MSLPRGAYAPIPTPVGDDGRLDQRALARHLAILRDGGLDGVLVMGTNGEFPSFDLDERIAAAGAAARSGHRLSLMLGVGSCALPEVLRLVDTAGRLGYESVLLPPPYYFRAAATAGLIGFFRAVLDASEIPVLLYHIPQVTGISITEEILGAVGDHPRFGGVKDSSGRADELVRFTTTLEGRSTMVGHDRLVSAAIAAGASGSITAAASVVPEVVVGTHRDPGRQPDLDAVRALLERYGLGGAVKALLRHRGVGAYRTRPPLLDLDEDSAHRLVSEFDALLEDVGRI